MKFETFLQKQIEKAEVIYIFFNFGTPSGTPQGVPTLKKYIFFFMY